ncbi:hypothetical protein FIE12Z_3807 [Fusarium flagelliforme]|uniref:Uncharacterized protein n=2 Tax=Fusarium incarnatum-equiseti species complex TaxID=450425 RepID=A0A395MXQ0_9HYPO|nr:hypothetical protein FIE12Z_3807 [Fusarium flagelliforme]
MGSAALYTSERRDPRCFDLPFGNRLRSSTMHISDDFHMLRERVQTIVRQRRRKEKRSLDISAPFNFEKNPVNLPGVSDEQLAMLREQAAASRIGIADPPSPIAPRSPCSTSSLFSHPVRPAMKSVHTSNSVSSTESLH